MRQEISGKNLTYGEAYTLEQHSMDLIDGVWQQTIFVMKKKQKMSRDAAARYYNTKLFRYWLKDIDFKTKSEALKKRAIAYLMFHNLKKEHIKLEDKLIKEILHKEKK